jgi:hypothetical protein
VVTLRQRPGVRDRKLTLMGSDNLLAGVWALVSRKYSQSGSSADFALFWSSHETDCSLHLPQRLRILAGNPQRHSENYQNHRGRLVRRISPDR